MISNKRLYLTAATPHGLEAVEQVVVEEGDPRAALLLVGENAHMEDSVAEKYGLIGGPYDATEALTPAAEPGKGLVINADEPTPTAKIAAPAKTATAAKAAVVKPAAKPAAAKPAAKK